MPDDATEATKATAEGDYAGADDAHKRALAAAKDLLEASEAVTSLVGERVGPAGVADGPNAITLAARASHADPKAHNVSRQRDIAVEVSAPDRDSLAPLHLAARRALNGKSAGGVQLVLMDTGGVVKAAGGVTQKDVYAAFVTAAG